MTTPPARTVHPAHAAAIVLAAGAAVAGALLAVHDGAWWWLHWLGKPLATGLILALAWRAQPAQLPAYRRWVLAGMAASLVGDVLLMLPGDLFVPGLVAFLIAHGCFIAAFLADSRFAAPAWPLAACLGYGAVNLALLWGAVAPPLRGPVIAYVVVLALMSGQAGARALARRGTPRATAARWALCGALLFMLSDTLLAWDRFRGPLPLAPLWILATYYPALWGLARSVRGARDEGDG